MKILNDLTNDEVLAALRSDLTAFAIEGEECAIVFDSEGFHLFIPKQDNDTEGATLAKALAILLPSLSFREGCVVAANAILEEHERKSQRAVGGTDTLQ